MKVQIKIDAVTTLDIENNMPGVSSSDMTRVVITQQGYDGSPDKVIDRRLSATLVDDLIDTLQTLRRCEKRRAP